jgi:hypothetical protein
LTKQVGVFVCVFKSAVSDPSRFGKPRRRCPWRSGGLVRGSGCDAHMVLVPGARTGCGDFSSGTSGFGQGSSKPRWRVRPGWMIRLWFSAFVASPDNTLHATASTLLEWAPISAQTRFQARIVVLRICNDGLNHFWSGRNISPDRRQSRLSWPTSRHRNCRFSRTGGLISTHMRFRMEPRRGESFEQVRSGCSQSWRPSLSTANVPAHPSVLFSAVLYYGPLSTRASGAPRILSIAD